MTSTLQESASFFLNKVLVKEYVTISSLYRLWTFHLKAKLDATGVWREGGDGSPAKRELSLGTWWA